ncbi:condensation domain-containing protein [Nostoc sp. FACHB-145]|uniref:condensation domain-containing protein n=1 Tax=Nostoc sp. FACHB-145 TaxID=2692836 RepID=UPI001689EDA7|nr:condensation domain-containing protein [Nostoc sp. FACHB-145]MBD2468780.1 AMP-binding protein [Nostoc sp. FACHB-145]
MTQYVKDLEKNVGQYSTVVELLRYRSIEQANQEAFTFLHDGETPAGTLTYQELDRQSRAIASQLQALGLSGERALLLYPPAIDYLPAFFGCLYAGVVAVPAYPPRNQRNTPRILAILNDAQTAVILTTTAIKAQLQSLLSDKFNINSVHWLTTDNLTPGIEEAWQEPFINTDTLAFLQYTSGSTGTPKGVMLTHGNLLHNAEVTRQYMEHTSSSKFVTWLPVYHDMGLIGGVLQPLYGGFPCIMMPPAAFLQRPYRWLEVISRYGGTTSGAPNFAYELCIEKITPEQRATLDLSSWSVAFNGAEPIRYETLERFAATFAESGFRPEAFYPCYGMAEATLMVSGSVKSALVRNISLQKNALERNHVINVVANVDNSIKLVSCGRSVPQQQVVIANLETLTRCQDKEVGEIWVSGPSVGKGYWNRTEETQQTFHAFLQDTKEGPFLRTGDLGFIDNGEVFITGRAKDLIIIRGRNLYPQDIELCAERSHPGLRLGSSAAFAVEVEQEEKLVVVQELEFRAKPNLAEVTDAIRQAVSQAFEVQVYAVVLIKPGSIPKTSSGKIQRRATKAEFLAGTLNIVQSSILDHADVSLPKEQPTNIETYLQQLVAQVLSAPLEQVNVQQPLSNLGIDSLQAFDLKNRIQQDFGVSISAVDLFEASIVQIVEQVLATKTTAVTQQLQPAPRNCELPLCLAQERLWFLDQLEPGNPFYNVAIAIRLTGKLNPVILEQSLNEIIKRHESLRTSFPAIDGRPIQIIHESLEIKLSIWQNCDFDIQNVILQETQQPFDLSQLPLLRAKLIHQKEDEHLLLISIHHIIADGWSIGILIQELAKIYAAFSVGKPSPLPELSIQYADYAYWQRQWLQTDILQPQLAYWKQQLSNSAPLLQLPIDRTRPEIQNFKGKKEFFTINGEIKQAVKHLNQQEGVTLFMTLLAVFQTLLYCYTKQEDILVGSPVVGRNWRETENLIGFFINTLVFRTDFSKNPSFREVLQRLRACALDAYAHQDLPFEKLVEELQPERNLSYNPLFQVMFILQNAPIPAIELTELTMHPQEVDVGTSKFDLKFSIWESSEGFQGSMEYKTDLFNAGTIARMNNHFAILLSHVVEQPDSKVQDLTQILAQSDREKQLIQEQKLEQTSVLKLKLTKRKAIPNT